LILVAEVVVRYLATGQFKQPEPSVEYLPAGHDPHVARLMAAVKDPVPAAQFSVQALTPFVLAYFPPGQLVQLAASFTLENVPSLQSLHLLYLKRPLNPRGLTP